MQLTTEQEEEVAFYESGLSAHGCLEHLDSYTKSCITRYGRFLVQKERQKIIEGFQGCCYTCEPVGILNQNLFNIVESFYDIIQSIQSHSKYDSIIEKNSLLHNKITNSLNLYKEFQHV